MRIVFVRHGAPDSEHDCLTGTGRQQAAAAAERLLRENISKIYVSSNGRARETASYTARALDLPLHQLDYMHEISWGGEGIPVDGHPWTLGDWMIEREDFDFFRRDWRSHPYFAKNLAAEYYDRITREFDALLLSHGYRHERVRFLCEAEKDETVAVFSHGGSGACVLAHLLALPFPYVCSVLPYDFTSIIILELPFRPGEYVKPRLELFNDCAHIRTQPRAPRLQQHSET